MSTITILGHQGERVKFSVKERIADDVDALQVTILLGDLKMEGRVYGEVLKAAATCPSREQGILMVTRALAASLLASPIMDRDEGIRRFEASLAEEGK